MTDWKAQGFFETMGNKDFRNFIYIDSSIAKPYLYDICLKCAWTIPQKSRPSLSITYSGPRSGRSKIEMYPHFHLNGDITLTILRVVSI